ncbi:MAG: chemotaxis protein CheW [Alphaproteobacteria bacterium]|nr:chemotaxis protein CheW [Alphaproteobacteria bacterium]
MGQLDQFVVFSLDEQRYALPLQAIERIVRAVEVTALPHAPPMVLGVIDMAGRILPVLSLRQHFGLPDRAVVPADRFLIARTALRTVAVVIDEAQGGIERRQSDVGGRRPGAGPRPRAMAERRRCPLALHRHRPACGPCRIGSSPRRIGRG